jgi:hypothetical protein
LHFESAARASRRRPSVRLCPAGLAWRRRHSAACTSTVACQAPPSTAGQGQRGRGVAPRNRWFDLYTRVCEAGKGARWRGHRGWKPNPRTRDHGCSSIGGNLFAMRARSAFCARRRLERGRIRHSQVVGTTHLERRRSSSHDRHCDDGNRASYLPRCRARRPTAKLSGAPPGCQHRPTTLLGASA